MIFVYDKLDKKWFTEEFKMKEEIYFDWYIDKLNDTFVFNKVDRLNIIGEDEFGNIIKVINDKVYIIIHDSLPSKILLCESLDEFNKQVKYYNQEEKNRRFEEFSKNIKDDDDYEYLVKIKTVAQIIGGKRINSSYINAPLYNITKAWKNGEVSNDEYKQILSLD